MTPARKFASDYNRRFLNGPFTETRCSMSLPRDLTNQDLGGIYWMVVAELVLSRPSCSFSGGVRGVAVAVI